MLRLRLENAPLGSRNVEWSGLEQRRAEMETSPEVAALPPLRSRAPTATNLVATYRQTVLPFIAYHNRS
jgi:hypothetical protein